MQEHNWVRARNGYVCSSDEKSPRMTSYYNGDTCRGCGAFMSDHLFEGSGYLDHQSGDMYWGLDSAWKNRPDCHELIMLVEEAKAQS